MTIMRIKGIKRVRSKGRTYFYHRKTSKPIKAEWGTAKFFEECVRLDEQARSRKSSSIPGSLGTLISMYRASPEFQNLKPRTQADYQRSLDYLKPHAELPLSYIDRRYALEVRDAAFAKHKRRFANYVLAVLSAILTFACDRAIVNTNAVKGTPKIKRPAGLADANRPWSDSELKTVLEACQSEGLRVAIILGAYAGMRQQDAISVTWSSYNGHGINWKAKKTGKNVYVPAADEVRATLDKMDRKDAVTLVRTKRGTSFT